MSLKNINSINSSYMYFVKKRFIKFKRCFFFKLRRKRKLIYSTRKYNKLFIRQKIDQLQVIKTTKEEFICNIITNIINLGIHKEFNHEFIYHKKYTKLKKKLIIDLFDIYTIFFFNIFFIKNIFIQKYLPKWILLNKIKYFTFLKKYNNTKKRLLKKRKKILKYCFKKKNEKVLKDKKNEKVLKDKKNEKILKNKKNKKASKKKKKN